MKKYPELTKKVAEENVERRNLREIKIGTQRVDLQLDEHLRFQVIGGSFNFTIDEPVERGGTNAGLPPLAHFLAGAASCLLTQYAKLALEKGVQIESMKAIARGHFDRRIGGAFKDVIYDVDIRSPATPESIVSLAHEAESMCYVHNTLKRTVQMQTNLTLNGSPVGL